MFLSRDGHARPPLHPFFTPFADQGRRCRKSPIQDLLRQTPVATCYAPNERPRFGRLGRFLRWVIPIE